MTKCFWRTILKSNMKNNFYIVQAVIYKYARNCDDGRTCLGCLHVMI